ncbi:MAG: ABC transporter substrate-binding protein, partial [Anaerolineaceae bacterium]
FSACSSAPAGGSTPAAQTGGALRWGIPYEPDTLDPHKTRSEYSNYVMSLIGSALTTVGPDGSIIPYAAQSWSVSADGLVWEFQLRSDMTFHSADGSAGDPITAKDYAWTYTRAIHPDTASPAAAALLKPLVRAEAVDDFTLRLTLSEPRPGLLFNLSAAGYLQPLPRRVLEEMGEEAFGRSPMGSGPFRLKRWMPNNRLILDRNPAYTWGPDTGQGTGPYSIGFVEFRILPDEQTLLKQLQEGVIDAAFVDADDLAAFDDPSRFDIYAQPLQGLQPYLAINLQQPPLDDLNVRKALNLALDRRTLIDDLQIGDALVQYGPLSVSMNGYWPGVEDAGYRYDPDQAADFLLASGYRRADGETFWSRDGRPLVIEFLTAEVDEPTARLTQAIAEQYRAFGLDVRLVTVDAAAIAEQTRAGDYQMALAGWSYPDADLLYLLFHSGRVDFSSPGPSNIQRVTDPQLDALLEQIHGGANPADRQSAIVAAQQYLLEKAVLVPLYTPVQHLVLGARVEGELFSPAFGLNYAGAHINE